MPVNTKEGSHEPAACPEEPIRDSFKDISHAVGAVGFLLESPKKSTGCFLSMASSTVWVYTAFSNDRVSFPFLPEETDLVPEEGPLHRFYMKMRFSLPFIRSKDCLSTTAALPKSLPYPAVFSSITGNMALKPPFIRFRGSTAKQAALSYLPKTPHSIICSLRPP